MWKYKKEKRKIGSFKMFKKKKNHGKNGNTQKPWGKEKERNE